MRFLIFPLVHFVYFLHSSKYSDLFGPRNLVDGGRAVGEGLLAPPLKVAVHVPAGGVDFGVGEHRLGPLPSENVDFYRVTIQLVQNLRLTSRQKFRFGLVCPGLARPKRNFCLEVNWRFCTSGMVTLYLLVNLLDIVTIAHLHIRGDPSPCAKPPVDFKIKVPLWPGQARAGQAKVELYF